MVVKVLLKNSTQSGCVFQDIEPPKANLIERKGTQSLGPKRSVQFSKGTLRHVKNSGKKGSIARVIQHTSSHVRSLYGPKVEDRSEEKP